MAVQERFSFDVRDSDEALAIAQRLAASCRSSLRWAARWTEDGVVVVPSPSAERIRQLIAQAGDASVYVHWRPRLYTGDDGDDAPWISYVDPTGRTRDDARVYRIELTCNAVPFSTNDQPSAPDFEWGPERSKGVRLETQLIRDHMARAELVVWLAAAAAVRVDSIQPL